MIVGKGKVGAIRGMGQKFTAELLELLASELINLRAGGVVKEGNFVTFGALILDVLVQLFQLFVVDVGRDGLVATQQFPVQDTSPVSSDLQHKTA